MIQQRKSPSPNPEEIDDRYAGQKIEKSRQHICRHRHTLKTRQDVLAPGNPLRKKDILNYFVLKLTTLSLN